MTAPSEIDNTANAAAANSATAGEAAIPASTNRGSQRGPIIGLLVIAALLAIAVEPTGTIRGRLLGEAFFTGRSVSYWGRQLIGGPAEQAAARSEFEKGGKDGVPLLVEMLTSSPSAELRWTAASLLKKLGPDALAASPALVAALQDEDPFVRSIAVGAVPQVGTPADEAVTALIPLLDSKDAAEVARAISVYKAQAAPALPHFVEILTDTSRDTEARWNAARAIGKTGPPAIETLPVLIEMTSDEETTVRGNAAEAIGDIGPTATAGIPALIECLKDPGPRVRHHAVRSLGFIGPAAKHAIPFMEPLLKDPEEMVSSVAKDAIKAIDPEHKAVTATEASNPVQLQNPQ